MLVPSIFANSVFDDFFDFPYVNDKKTERKLYGHNAANLMKTDIQEYDDGYQLEIDLPGFKKDEVHAELKDGYLVVSAEKGLDEMPLARQTSPLQEGDGQWPSSHLWLLRHDLLLGHRHDPPASHHHNPS